MRKILIEMYNFLKCRNKLENINCSEPYIPDYNYSSTIFNLLRNRESFNIYVTIPYEEKFVC